MFFLELMTQNVLRKRLKLMIILMLSTKRFLRYWTVFSLDSISYFSFYWPLYVLDKKLEEIYQNITWIDVLGQINKFDWGEEINCRDEQSIKLGKKHLWLRGIQVCPNEGPTFSKGSLLRNSKNTLTKFYNLFLKNVSI